MILKLGFWALTLLDAAIALIIFISALSPRMPHIPVWYRIGLVITALGFTVQGFLNLPFLLFNTILMAQQLPFWVLKDIGIAIIANYFFWCVLRKTPPLKKAPVRPRKAALKKTPTPRAPRKKTSA